MELTNKLASVPSQQPTVDEAIQKWLREARSLKTAELFFEMASNYICVTGDDGLLKRASRAFIKATGYSEAELMSDQFAEFIVKKEAVAGNEHASYYFVTHFCCKNNRVIKIRWRVIPDIVPENTFIVGKEVE